MVKKILLGLFLLAAFVLVFHNASVYPYDVGYDARLHLKYANIVSGEWRIPTFTETRENYNPPGFYLVSGLVGRLAGFKAWQYVNVVLAMTGLYLWYQTFVKINPKAKVIALAAVAIIFSWPVFHKTIVMFSIEAFFMFTISLAFWYFVCHFSKKPNLKSTLILSLIVMVNLLTRMSALVLLGTLVIAMLWQRQFKFTVILLLVSLLGSGWFYLGRDSQEVYGVGEGGQPEIPFFQRQPLSFYVDVPFTLMMTYPMRQNQPLNKLIPIFYSEFWGDFWNYYPQPRFGLPISEVRKNREISNQARIKSLVRQNQVNLVPTLMLVAGFGYLIIKNLNKKPLVTELTMILFTLLTWIGFLTLLTMYPSWKSDSVKASYMLYALPILGYALSLFVFKVLKRYRLLFIPAVLILILSAIVNLNWSWF